MPLIPPDAEIIDITVPFSTAVPTWPTHPRTAIEPFRRVARGDTSNVSLVAISSHAGTHADAHYHFIEDGPKLLDIPLSRWIGPCVVIRVADAVGMIEPAHLEAATIPLGTERLLIRTVNSAAWVGFAPDAARSFDEHSVALSPAAARWIVARGIKLVGVDYLSAGPFGPANIETHMTLLGNDVLIVETLDLSAVAPGPYELICLPLKLAVGDGAPARVLLVRVP